MSDKEIVGKECRFVTYVEPKDKSLPDLHVVKELVHYKDGSIEPKLNLIKNFKRPFWITHKGKRNHKSKKEWESLENVLEFKSTQSELAFSVAKALGQPWSNMDMRRLSSSPYVYGTDIASGSLIKQQYAKKYETTKNTKHSVAVCDTETDVLNGTNEIIMASFTCKDIVFTAVVKSFLENQSNVEERLDRAMVRYLGDIVKARNIKAELVIVESPIHAVIEVIKVAHKRKPDFLTFWNIDFDVTRILEACDKYGYDPKDIFSDPDLPLEYRAFHYKRGKDKKITVSGKITPVKPANRWHVVTTPASFYMIDSMCVYRHLRLAKQELQSYALDFVLNVEKVKGKLKFEEANEYSGLAWHSFMQKNYPIEYIVYNRYDCICVELLDEKTNDLAISLPLFSGYSDYKFFSSQPRRIVDDLHFEALDSGRVIGSTGNDMDDDLDEDSLDLRGWIITLPAHTVSDNGLKVIDEYPDIRTRIYTEVGDLDVAGSYPNGQAVFNISKETTVKELVDVEGIPEEVFRMQNINLSGGLSNALEYCQIMFNFPTLVELGNMFDNRKNEWC